MSVQTYSIEFTDLDGLQRQIRLAYTEDGFTELTAVYAYGTSEERSITVAMQVDEAMQVAKQLSKTAFAAGRMT